MRKTVTSHVVSRVKLAFGADVRPADGSAFGFELGNLFGSALGDRARRWVRECPLSSVQSALTKNQNPIIDTLNQVSQVSRPSRPPQPTVRLSAAVDSRHAAYHFRPSETSQDSVR